MRIAICDDSIADAQAISALLTEYSQSRSDHTLEFEVFLKPEALLQAPLFDLYLLDILMGHTSGIDLAATLRSQGCDSSIVFLTSSPDYALRAFGVQASGYLLKPAKKEELFAALDKAIRELAFKKHSTRKPFTFRIPGGYYNTNAGDILCVEVMGHTPIYHLTTGDIRGSDLRIPFSESTTDLEKLGCFLKPHRSFLVNAAHITAITNQQLELDNGEVVPIARMRLAETKARYFDYLMEAHHE